jgi:hypothetical protein
VIADGQTNPQTTDKRKRTMKNKNKDKQRVDTQLGKKATLGIMVQNMEENSQKFYRIRNIFGSSINQNSLIRQWRISWCTWLTLICCPGQAFQYRQYLRHFTDKKRRREAGKEETERCRACRA